MTAPARLFPNRPRGAAWPCLALAAGGARGSTRRTSDHAPRDLTPPWAGEQRKAGCGRGHAASSRSIRHAHTLSRSRAMRPGLAQLRQLAGFSRSGRERVQICTVFAPAPNRWRSSPVVARRDGAPGPQKEPFIMRNMHQLRETRAAKVDTLKALATKAETEKREMTEAETREFDAGKAEIDRLDADIRRAEFLADAERRAHAEPLTAGRDSLAGLEARYQIGRALADYLDKGRLTGVEAEFAAEHRSGRAGGFAVPTGLLLGRRETRALTTTTPSGGPGGNMVATELGPMIDRQRPTLAVELMGATILSGLTSNLDLPRLKASGQAGWVAEHGAATRTDAQFDKVAMGPKTVAAEYEMSRRMMIQAPQIETILRADIGYLLAQALDGAAIKGGGSNEPTGILGTAGVPVVAIGTNGGALTLDHTADLIGAVDAADAIGPRGFLTNAKVRKAAMKLKDAENRPYGVPAVFHNEPATFSNQVPGTLTKGSGTNLSAILYGAWADLVIGYWSAVDIVVNPYHGDVASKGGALLHAFLDADIALRHAESFAVAKDVVA